MDLDRGDGPAQVKEPRVAVIYDETAGLLSTAWALGALVNKTPLDYAVATLKEWLETVENLPPEVHEVHYWGHGRPGAPLVAGSWITADDIVGADGQRQMTFWWRSCSVHRGNRGQGFAGDLAVRGVTSVGHTRVIGFPRQPRICGIRPGEVPWWSLQGEELRGVWATEMKIPNHAWKDLQR